MRPEIRLDRILLFTSIIWLCSFAIPDVSGHPSVASSDVDSLAILKILDFIDSGKLLAISDEVGIVIDESENNQYQLFPAYPGYKYAFFVQLPGSDFESYVLCETHPGATLIIAEKTTRTQKDIDNIVGYLRKPNRTTKTTVSPQRLWLELIGGAAGFAISGLFMYMVPELGTGPATLWLGVSSAMTSYPVYYLGSIRNSGGSFAQTFMGTAFAAFTFYGMMNMYDWKVDSESLPMSDPDNLAYWAPASILMVGSSVISFNRSLNSENRGGTTSIRAVGGLNTQIHFPSLMGMNLFAKPGERSFLIPILSLQFN